MSGNQIRKITYKDGFKELYSVAIEDNLISSWLEINMLNEYRGIRYLRMGGNPIVDMSGVQASRQLAIAKMRKVGKLNGTDVPEGERRDCELQYTR